MICSLNHILTVKILTEDLISASADESVHNTGYIANLPSCHKTRPAR